jgi:hypothetical protein
LRQRARGRTINAAALRGGLGRFRGNRGHASSLACGGTVRDIYLLHRFRRLLGNRSRLREAIDALAVGGMCITRRRTCSQVSVPDKACASGGRLEATQNASAQAEERNRRCIILREAAPVEALVWSWKVGRIRNWICRGRERVTFVTSQAGWFILLRVAVEILTRRGP